MQMCYSCFDWLASVMASKRVRRTSNVDDAFTTIYLNVANCKKLQKIVDLGIKDSTGWSLLHRAVINEDCDMIRTLCSLGMNTGNVSNDVTPLQLAVGRGCTKVVETLLDCGCCQRVLDNGCCASLPPLVMAMCKMECRYDLVQLLLSHGCDVNKQLIDGQVRLDSMPLCYSIRNRDLKMTDILLNSGAKIVVSDTKESVSAFIDAILLSCKAIVELLIHHGADVNEPGKSSRTIHRWRLTEMTPLQASILAQNISVMETLLSYGADPTIGLKQRALLNFIPCHSPLCMVSLKASLFGQLKLLLQFNTTLTWNSHSHLSSAKDEHSSPLCFVSRNDKALKLLLQCGCRPRTDKELKALRNLVELRMDDGSDLSPWITHFWTNPQSLTEICRNTIRKFIGLGISDKLNDLYLPRKIHSFLLLEDLLDDENDENVISL